MYLADNSNKFAAAVYRLGEGEQVIVPDVVHSDWVNYVKAHISETLYLRKLHERFIYSTIPFKSTL